MTFRIYADVEAAINDLLAGNIDIVDNITPPRVAEVQATVPNFAESPSSSVSYLGMPLYDPAFENPDVRAALSMAIDRVRWSTARSSTDLAGRRSTSCHRSSPVMRKPCVTTGTTTRSRPLLSGSHPVGSTVR